MPINNTLPDIENPTKIMYNEEPTTKFIDHLSNIKVELLSAVSIDELKSYIPRWATATWKSKPLNNYSEEEREDILKDLFKGNILPSALETVNLVFLVSNMDLIDVTHLLRHRTMSFSAICSADRDLRHDDAMVKSSIKAHSNFYDRYTRLVEGCKQLYADMVDTDEISLLDARTILPRCLEQHYYCRVNLKDVLHFIRQRIDRQIQPESDNIIALKMWICLVRQYPFLKGTININDPDMWYVKTAPTGRSSNIYMPEKPRNDIFEYKPQWFLYKKQRSEMSGGYEFIKLWFELVKELESIHG